MGTNQYIMTSLEIRDVGTKHVKGIRNADSVHVLYILGLLRACWMMTGWKVSECNNTGYAPHSLYARQSPTFPPEIHSHDCKA